MTKEYDDKNLAWMLFVDGCAILQFIYSDVHKGLKESKIKKDLKFFVNRDLFLLENQLPYQLLDDLMKMREDEENLRKAILKFINGQSMLENEQPKGEKWTNMATDKDAIHLATDKDAIHLLDLLRTRLLADQSVEKDMKCAIPFCTSKSSKKKDWQSFRNVQELKAAGIYLKSSHNSCLRISFPIVSLNG